MIAGYSNLLPFVGAAGAALAPVASTMEPTVAEALEEHARAKRYRDDAVCLGLLVGGALGIGILALRKQS